MDKTRTIYNIVVLTYDDIEYYIIWYSEDKEGFILKENTKKVMKFKNIDDAKKFAIKNNINLENHIAKINFNKDLLYQDDIDSKIILSFWNNISDLSKSLKVDFIGDDDTNEDINNIYSKLFHGNNLPAYIGDRKRLYVPKWTKKEKSIIKQIVSQGLEILESAL